MGGLLAPVLVKLHVIVHWSPLRRVLVWQTQLVSGEVINVGIYLDGDGLAHVGALSYQVYFGFIEGNRRLHSGLCDEREL